MATTNNNKKILDLKRWEFCTPAPVASAAGMCVGSSRHYRQQQLYLTSNTVAYLYNPNEDGFVQIPSPALAGTFGAGVAITSGSFSIGTTTAAATLTATGGGASTINTNQSIVRSLKGYSIQIVGGPSAGDTREIASNTIGANSVITVTAPFTASPTASTTYRLITPVWYVVGAGTTAAGSFRKYDLATNTWTSLANTGLPTTIGTDGRLIATPSWVDNDYVNFATGTATAGAATTLTNSGKNWATNQWANFQIRITGGTGAGQIRTIASNTATVITVSANWATNPDATSTYAIQGNDDFIYYMGNNAVTLYRYSITSNTWTTLSPSVARAAAPVAGASATWVWGATDSAWKNEDAIINGRRIYSFRGNSATLDFYDIPSNAWTNAVSYAPATETFTTGSKYAYNGDYLYMQKDATGRWFRYSFPENTMDGWNTMTFTQGAAVVGDTCWDVTYKDGATEIVYVYMLLNTSAVVLRQMVV